MLSPVLLQTLRQYWRQAKPKQWLFPRESPDQPISGNDIAAVFHNAARRAGITKEVSAHSLRHCFARSLQANLSPQRPNNLEPNGSTICSTCLLRSCS